MALLGSRSRRPGPRLSIFTRAGIAGAPTGDPHPARRASDAHVPDKPPIAAEPSRDDAGDDLARLRCLCDVALLCGRTDLDIAKILAQVAQLLPGAMPQPEGSTCRIEFMGQSYWSPSYIEPRAHVERPLYVGAAVVGKITLGETCEPGDRRRLALAEELIDPVAGFVGQMLSRRVDRKHMEEQRAALRQKSAVLDQAGRLVKLGAWELDIAASSFTWSDEIKRIAGIEGEGALGVERSAIMSAFLLEAVRDAIATRKPIDREMLCPQPDGSLRRLHALGEIITQNGDPVRAVGLMRDVTEEREAQSKLLFIANHDTLTALPNRRHFQERLEAALMTRGARGALLMLDLDNFKDVNDTSGHDVGDGLLKAFARRLEEEVADTASIARLGGDEFAVLFPNARRTQAEYAAASLLERLRAPVDVYGRMTAVRLSAGLTVFPDDGRATSDLMKNADLALYAAKARGRNLLVNYTAQLREAVEKRIAVCSDVQEGLDANQFVPFYQPKVDLRSGKLVGFEALLRWKHPTGLRSPGLIMPAFDVPDLSRALCSRMLDRMMVDMASWQARGVEFGRVAFNASSSEFDGFDLAGSVLWRLKSIGLPPASLGVEVTERVFLGRDTDLIGPILQQLHDAGIEVALDDFGTGYASLTHLQKFPVDVIKIDQSFIRNLLTDSDSQAITSVVLGLGRSLGMQVVAEGVETADQARLLKAAGCDMVQGYFFGRPMAASDVPDFIAGWSGVDGVADLVKSAA
jgi:diguanylate cyclase (GGDEF)-like protein